MSLNITCDENRVLGRLYNVAYDIGNGRIETFSNILENVDGTYFWFSSEEHGLDCIKQDRIIIMSCCERNKRERREDYYKFHNRTINKNEFYALLLKDMSESKNFVNMFSTSFKNICRTYDIYFSKEILTLAMGIGEDMKKICGKYFSLLNLVQYKDRKHFEE